MGRSGLTLETILTHPAIFGLTKATPLQRAICRALDGLSIGDLATHPVVVKAMGGEAAIEALERQTCMPKEFYLIAGIRGGKSLITAAVAIRSVLECDMTYVTKPDIAMVSVVSIRLKNAKVIMRHLTGALNKPLLKPMIVGKILKESVMLRRQDGHMVQIHVVAGAAGAANLVSTWSAGIIFDEAPRMADDGAISFSDQRQYVIERLLPGAQIIAVGSPHAPFGPMYDAVTESWGKPSEQLVVVKATGPDLNPVWWTPKRVEDSRRFTPDSYITDCLGEFADVEGGLFFQADIIRATREHSMTLPREVGWHYFAAQDPAISRNAWTLVIVGYMPAADGKPENGRFRVVRTKQWQGSPIEPLKAKVVLRELAGELKAYGLTEVHSDTWGAGLLSELAEESNLSVLTDSDTTAQKDQRWLDLVTRIISGQVELSPDPVLRADLLSARKRPTANGTKVDLPISKDGRHGDFAPALNLAIGKAAQGLGWAEHLTAWRANNGGIAVF